MRKIAVAIGTLVLGLLCLATLLGAFYAPIWLRHADYYPRSMAGYAPGAIVAPNLNDLAAQPTPPAEAPADQPQAVSAGGTVLIDLAHENNFDLTELSLLLGRVTERGAHVEYVETSDALSDKLRSAQALIVVVPEKALTDGEIQQVRQFVARGGKLLLIAEPTKTQVYYQQAFDPSPGGKGYQEFQFSDVRYVNRLAGAFGAFFAEDYLYNLVSNDGHFQRLIMSQFQPQPLTEGLRSVTFQVAHSVVGSIQPLVWGDENTLSSQREPTDRMTPMGLAADGKVVLLGDLSCLSEPANARYSNDRLVANLADFLARAGRDDDLSAFPVFFGPQISLVYLEAASEQLAGESLSAGGSIQSYLREHGRTTRVVPELPADADSIVLGRYDQASSVQELLGTQGVTLRVTLSRAALLRQLRNAQASSGQTPGDNFSDSVLSSYLGQFGQVQGTISLDGVGAVDMAQSGLVAFTPRGEHRAIVILAGGESGLADMVGRLTGGRWDDCLTQGNVTVCSLYHAGGAPAAVPTPPATATPAGTPTVPQP